MVLISESLANQDQKTSFTSRFNVKYNNTRDFNIRFSMGCGDKLNLSVKGQTQFAPTYILIFTDTCTNSEFGRQAID